MYLQHIFLDKSSMRDYVEWSTSSGKFGRERLCRLEVSSPFPIGTAMTQIEKASAEAIRKLTDCMFDW